METKVNACNYLFSNFYTKPSLKTSSFLKKIGSRHGGPHNIMGKHKKKNKKNTWARGVIIGGSTGIKAGFCKWWKNMFPKVSWKQKIYLHHKMPPL